MYLSRSVCSAVIVFSVLFIGITDHIQAAEKVEKTMLRFASLFQDHAVLQRDQNIPVWGWAAAATEVEVILGKMARKTIANDAGRWQVDFPAHKAGGPFVLQVNSGEKNIELKDIYIGEVWLMSGQSNMEFPLKWLGDLPSKEESTNNMLRLFHVGGKAAGEAQQDALGTWALAQHNKISTWPGTPFYFGKDLQAHSKVAVGLIVSAVGGTPIESWVKREELVKQKDIMGHVGWLEKQVREYPKNKKEADEKMKEWELAKQVAKKAGKKAPKKPRLPPLYSPTSSWRPAGLYNGKIAPLSPYAIRGIAWYQGESNVSRAKHYAETFKKLINSWRADWNNVELPFIFVQLANYNDKKTNWGPLRLAQLEALSLPKVGMATAIDIGDTKDIHPKNKRDLGARILLTARALAYGENVESNGPLAQKAVIKDDALVVSFTSAKGLKLKSGTSVNDIEMAGADKKFYAAHAIVQGERVIVTSDKVKDAKFVRYAHKSDPKVNLYNAADLPAAPFSLFIE